MLPNTETTKRPKWQERREDYLAAKKSPRPAGDEPKLDHIDRVGQLARVTNAAIDRHGFALLPLSFVAEAFGVSSVPDVRLRLYPFTSLYRLEFEIVEETESRAKMVRFRRDNSRP